MIAVPYVAGLLKPETAEWASANGASLVELGGGDDSYWAWLRDAWRLQADLMIVEEDILPPPRAVERLADCPRPWCAFRYRVAANSVVLALGCVRFRARLTTRHPRLVEEVGEVTGDGLPAKDWRRLDVRMDRALKALDYRPHDHGWAQHLHKYR